MMVSTRLALLLGAQLEKDGPAPLEKASLERVLAWCRKTPIGEDGLPLDLAAAPDAAGRLAELLGRGALLDRMLGEWERSGFWVIGRDEPDYPKRLRRRLRMASPALLFGSGDRSLLNRGGIALVAGRTVAPFVVDRLRVTLGEEDLTAITLDGTVRTGSGETIAMRRDGSITAQPDGHGVLVGLFEPGRAGDETMDAERCLYGMADAALLIGVERGDPTWAGAVSAIEREMLPVWVRGDETDASLLIRAGARMLPSGPIVPRDLLRPEASAQGKRATTAMTPTQDMAKPAVVQGFAESQAGFFYSPPTAPRPISPLTHGGHLRLVGAAPPVTVPMREMGQTLFALFSDRLSGLLAHGPLGVGRIADAMDLTRVQTEAWLMRAEAEHCVRRDTETAMFELIDPPDHQ